MIKCTPFISQPVVRYLVQCIYSLHFIASSQIPGTVYILTASTQIHHKVYSLPLTASSQIPGTVYTLFLSQPVADTWYTCILPLSYAPPHTWNIVYTPSSSQIPGAVSSFGEEVIETISDPDWAEWVRTRKTSRKSTTVFTKSYW